MKISPLRIGLVFGLFLLLFHAAWAALVALGWAQPLLDFVFWAHFITPAYHVEPFQLQRAVDLLVFVFIVGMAFGTLAGWLWQRLKPVAGAP